MPTFTTPTALLLPQTLPDSSGLQKRLFNHYQLQAQGVTVFKLSDNTYVQDYPTPENSNTAIPYPIINDGGPYESVYDIFEQRTDYFQTPHVVFIYYGGHNYTVTQAEAALLEAAGYTVHGNNASVVQTVEADSGATSNATSLTMSGVTITTGNAMVLVIGVDSNSSAPSVTSVSDGVNTWAKQASVSNVTPHVDLEIWATTNATPSLSSGTITVSVNEGAATVCSIAAVMLEIHEANNTSILDVSSTNTPGGASSSVSTGATAALGAANEVVIAAVVYPTHAVVPSNGTFTAGAPSESLPTATTTYSTSANSLSLHVAVASIASQAAQTYTETGSNSRWCAAIVALQNNPA